jgi:hypothetical protein
VTLADADAGVRLEAAFAWRMLSYLLTMRGLECGRHYDSNANIIATKPKLQALEHCWSDRRASHTISTKETRMTHQTTRTASTTIFLPAHQGDTFPTPAARPGRETGYPYEF